MKRIAIVLGTRHEITKMLSMVRACERQGADWFMCHTGQHYSYNRDRVFFEQLELPGGRYNLDLGSRRHEGQSERMMAGMT